MDRKPVFKSEEGRGRIIDEYDRILQNWPLKNERLHISTRYGSTFVIASGPKDGRPVVLLHGSSTNSLMWMGDMNKLGRQYRAYAVDIIGEPGKSSDERPELVPDNYSDWLCDVMDGLGIEKATLVGNSLGGWMALCLATDKPERVEKLALIATSGIAVARLSFLLKALALSMFGETGRRSINRIVYGGVRVPEEVDAFGRLVFHNYNPRMGKLHLFSDDELRRLSMPLLLIVGDQDALLPSKKTAARLEQIVPAAKIRIIEGRGHVIVDCVDDIIRFLE